MEKNGKVIPFLLFGMQLFFAFASLFLREYFQFDLPAPRHDLGPSVQNNLMFLIIFMAIIIPIIEEVVFRLCLSLEVNQMVWSFFLGVIYLLIIGGNYLLIDAIYLIFLIAILGILIYRASYGISVNKKYISLFSIIVFSIIHLNNYDLNNLSQVIIFLPFLLGAQFILGVFTTILRLNYNFKFALAFHSLYNLTLLLVSHFTMP